MSANARSVNESVGDMRHDTHPSKVLETEEHHFYDIFIRPMQLRCRCAVCRPQNIALRHTCLYAGTSYAGAKQLSSINPRLVATMEVVSEQFHDGSSYAGKSPW